MEAADERVWAVTMNPHAMWTVSEFRRIRLDRRIFFDFFGRGRDAKSDCRRRLDFGKNRVSKNRAHKKKGRHGHISMRVFSGVPGRPGEKSDPLTSFEPGGGGGRPSPCTGPGMKGKMWSVSSSVSDPA